MDYGKTWKSELPVLRSPCKLENWEKPRKSELPVLRNKLQIIANYWLLRAEFQNSEIPNFKNQEKCLQVSQFQSSEKVKQSLFKGQARENNENQNWGPRLRKWGKYLKI